MVICLYSAYTIGRKTGIRERLPNSDIYIFNLSVNSFYIKSCDFTGYFVMYTKNSNRCDKILHYSMGVVSGGNGNNRWNWEKNGNKTSLNLGVGMNSWEWEGIGLKTFPLISSDWSGVQLPVPETYLTI